MSRPVVLYSANTDLEMDMDMDIDIDEAGYVEEDEEMDQNWPPTRGIGEAGSPVIIQIPYSEAKIESLPNGWRLDKRPLPDLTYHRTQQQINPFRSPNSPAAPADPRNYFPPAVPKPYTPNSAVAACDLTGYVLPPRARHATFIKVSSKSPFMSVVDRVRKALEKAPSYQAQNSKGQPLNARIAGLNNSNNNNNGVGAANRGHSGIISDAMDDVILVAAGKAIEKAVDVGAFFGREKDLAVVVRTQTVGTADDMFPEDEEEADEEDRVRMRNLSTVEVGIRWKF